MVANLSEDGNHTTIHQYFCPARLEPHYKIIFVTLRHHQAQMLQDNVHHGQPNGGGISLNITRYRKTVSSAL